MRIVVAFVTFAAICVGWSILLDVGAQAPEQPAAGSVEQFAVDAACPTTAQECRDVQVAICKDRGLGEYVHGVFKPTSDGQVYCEGTCEKQDGERVNQFVCDPNAKHDGGAGKLVVRAMPSLLAVLVYLTLDDDSTVIVPATPTEPGR